jgi:hypothetical protein
MRTGAGGGKISEAVGSDNNEVAGAVGNDQSAGFIDNGVIGLENAI